MKRKQTRKTLPNRGRHEAECRICRHPQRQDIDRAFVDWRSAATIAQEYKLRDPSTVYRHAHAFDLFGKRKANIHAALEAIIERAADVEVTASAVVAAIQAYAKINDVGKWIERCETVNLTKLFNRMTVDELENYARTGEVPGWFPVSPVATSFDGRERTN